MIPDRLFAPEQFWRLSPEVREKLTNGCGPGGWKIDPIPDTMYGLDVSLACNIHDFMYGVGLSLAEKEEADRVFLNNLLRLISRAGGWRLLQSLRRRRAYTYYLFVSRFGGPAFWSGKNPPITQG